MGIVLVAFLAARIGPSAPTKDDIHLETHQLGGKLRIPILLPLRISVLEGDVLSLYVATLAQSSRIPSERVDSVAGSSADRYPIRGTFFGCCASADEQSATSTAQRATTVLFLFMSFPLPLSTCHSTLDTRPFSLNHFSRPR
jgi:hypothetical protein